MTTKRIRCGRCRRYVLTGTDDLGIDVTLDLEVLDQPNAELTAVLDGRLTYSLHTTTNQITHRSPHRIVATPAGTRPRTEVHPDHRCEDNP
jgi:hypothetical protein